jgi:hypothetical protein
LSGIWRQRESEYIFGVPALVVVPIDYAENMKLSERLGNLVCPI